MKKMIFTVFLFFFVSLSVLADNGLGSIEDKLGVLTKSAFSERSKQMAVKVNLADKQCMLTQKMSKESLLISLKIDIKKNKKNLEVTAKLFAQILIGLQTGDKSLSLTKTTNQDILKQFEKITALWLDFKPNIESMYGEGDDNELLQNIASKNLPLLVEINKAVGLYEKSSGADLNDLATVINLSGKQRMLTQKMPKELLLIAKGIDVEKNKANLDKTIKLFDKILKGLVNGDTALGLSTTKDEKTLKQLAEVQRLWDVFKPTMEQADTGMESLKKVAELNLPLLSEMNKVVEMYEMQSKQAIYLERE
jgi:hypothetical protein